jgi:hypothetical protein
MKSLLALKEVTAKLKQQKKAPADAGQQAPAWVKKGDLEREREQKYFEE